MSKFAKIDEEVYRRQDELTGEEFRLYCIIFFHTFVDSGVCRRSLRQLALIYNLDYTRTTKRFKILLMDFSNLDKEEKAKRRQKIKSPWCEKVKGGIRPLVGSNVPKKGTFSDVGEKATFGDEMLAKGQHLYWQNANINVGEKATFGDEMLAKGQHTYKEYIEPLKSRDFSDNNNSEKDAVVSSTSDKNKSQFSLEEIFRYIEIRNSKGEKIETPQRYANWAHRSGEMDAFISATLYPPTATEKPIEPQVEYDDEYLPLPLDDSARQNALIILRGLKRDAGTIENLSEYYTAEDWKFFMEELGR